MKQLLVLAFLGLIQPAFAQVSLKDIEFDTQLIDFGTVTAEGGPLEANYTLVNKGKVDFMITGMDVACGCTKPVSSKDIIPPGDTAIIKVEFNPHGMVGTVSKWIRVEGNFSDALYKELRFNAEIISKGMQSEAERSTYYPGQYGYLVVYNRGLNIGKQVQGYQGMDSIFIYNDGYKTHQIMEIKGLPPYIIAPELPLYLEPKTSAQLYFKINMQNMDTVGPVSGHFKIVTDDVYFKEKSLNYSFDMEIDFSTWKKREIRKAAVFYVEDKAINMGEMKSGLVREKEISIYNKGKSPLIIYRIETDCTCAIIDKLEGVSIAPGDSIAARVKFDSLFKSGRQTKGITLYTNDPANPIVVLSVKAVVN